ncbi:hypothetical protein BRC93_08710 [Halobacteriales archaeon QS_5_70_15]|nr:MAG: hypothetical protein BRC93_08710 [Halobacteriales archaeon QS_5_70_15]
MSVSDSAWHGDEASPRDRVERVASAAVGEWHGFLFGGAAGLLVYALLNPGLGVSARAVELLFAGVAAVLPGVAVGRVAEGPDERWTPDPPKRGP